MNQLRNNIPLLFFHKGKSKYARLCMKQNRKYNNQCILLTDVPRYYKKYCHAVDYRKYESKSIIDFENLYEHFSTNCYEIELICITRWFYLYNYMNHNNINRAFIMDTDVMVFDDLSRIDHQFLNDFSYMLCSGPKQKDRDKKIVFSITGGQSLWSIRSLCDFVSFCTSFYTTQKDNMRKFYQEYSDPGGICDMTLLYYFHFKEDVFTTLRLPNQILPENDLTRIWGNELTFDLHLGAGGNSYYENDYEMTSDNIKHITFKNKQPYCFCYHLNKPVRFVLLHFQGRTKHLISNVYFNELCCTTNIQTIVLFLKDQVKWLYYQFLKVKNRIF